MIARWALRKIFERIGSKSNDTALRIEFSDGSVLRTHPTNTRSEVLVRFRTRRAEWHALLFLHEGLFEGFVSGDVDLEGEQPIATLARLWGTAASRPSPGLPCCEIR